MLSTQQLAEENVIVCPRCRSSLAPSPTLWRCTDADCDFSKSPFPVVAGLPILVDFCDSVLKPADITGTGSAPGVRRSRLPRALHSLVHPTNTTATTQLARMVAALRTDSPAGGSPVATRPRILVVGGGTVGNGLSQLYSDADVDLISFDIYVSQHVQFVGDGHAMALADETVDGVVVQAVLEHVLEPTKVVAEIRRVLRPGGIVYADTPFLQHVHEGAYDFTRFTDSGHRYLFRQFELIDSGTVAGAGTVLRWSIDYFVRALTRSTRLGRVAGLLFFWLSSLDRLLDPRHSLDGASSVYFLGRKTEHHAVSPTEIIAYYQGGISDDA